MKRKRTLLLDNELHPLRPKKRRRENKENAETAMQESD